MNKSLIGSVVKVVLLSPVCALGTGIIFNFFASILSVNGLSNNVVIGILIISYIFWIIALSYIYYSDYRKEYDAKENKSKPGTSGSYGRCGSVSSSNSSSDSGKASNNQGYNGPKTLPMGCYEPFFDLDCDGKMSEYETYLQWENEQHMKNDTPNDFWK